MINTKISFSYILYIIAAVIFTWTVHEFAHWLTYNVLGYDALMTLNKVSPLGPNRPLIQHSILAASAGPLITILQAIIVYSILKLKQWNKNLYPFLVAAFYMRFLAGAMNIINPNDEGKIGLHFEIGLFTVSIIVTGVLFYMVFHISKKHGLGWKFQAITALAIIITSSCLVMFDQFIGLRLL